MTERIRVVEDSPAVLEAYAATLEGGGYEVVQAPSGKLAQEILRTSGLDIVITDLRMPEIGGLDVLRIAKSTDPEIIVILIDRKSTRLNSSHTVISYAVFCLNKKNQPSSHT